MKKLCVLLIAATTISAGGCSTIRKHTAPEDENLLSGAGSITKQSPDQIDLDELIIYYGFKTKTEGSETIVVPDETTKYKYLRNDLQERLIAASNQKCSAYMRQLVTSKSQTHAAWTGLSLLLSGAASVTSHAQTAKVFAAGNSASTGMLSAYNEAYFNNLTITVISTGINKQRESILARISVAQDKELSQYTVNAAIADAISYHAACNIVSGLETAAKATNSIEPQNLSADPREAEQAPRLKHQRQQFK